MAVDEASNGVNYGDGGPFGAVVVRPRGPDTPEEYELVSRGHNMVLATCDPTAHAEVTAIRLACERLSQFHLTDCILLTSCFPCPMCMGACLWAQLGTVYFAASAEDASKLGGFNDAPYYGYVRGLMEKEVVTGMDNGDGKAGRMLGMKVERLVVDEYKRPFEEWNGKEDKRVLY